jgi:protein SCO1/2
MKTSQLTFVLGAVLLVNIPRSRAAESNTNAPVPSCCMVKAVASFVPACTDKSLYQVESKWTTDGGRPFRLGDLAGKPQVVLMFFSRCTSACPILLNDLKRINAALTPAQRAQVGFTLVSFDTGNDTPTVLAAYRQAWDLPAKGWTLLSGKPDDVLELAVLLGVKYRKDADGQFAHSNVITVLNTSGEIAHRQMGLNEDVSETVQTLAKLVKN